MSDHHHQLESMLKETHLAKELELIYDSLKNDGRALHWVSKVKTTEEEYVMPSTYQEFLGDLGTLFVDLEEVCQQLNEEIKKTKKPHKEMTVSKLLRTLECVNLLDSKDLDNKQNLPSSSSCDMDKKKIPNKDTTNDEPISELVQNWINRIKLADKNHDDQTKIGTESKNKDFAYYFSIKPTNKVQECIDKKNEKVPVASLPNNHFCFKTSETEPKQKESDKNVSKLPKFLKSNEKKEKVLKENSKPEDPIQHHKNAGVKVQTKKKEHSKLTKPYSIGNVELNKLLKDMEYDHFYQGYQKRKEKEAEELKALKLEVQKKNEKIMELEKMVKDSSHLAAENLELREEIGRMNSHILDLEWERDQHIFIREQQKLKYDRLEMHPEVQKTSDESVAKHAKIDDLEKRLKEKERENEELKVSIRNMIISDREAFKMVDNHYKQKMDEEKKMNSDRIDELTAQMEKLTKCVEKLMK